MMRWSRSAIVVVVCMMVFMGTPMGVRAQVADNWGFETGTLAGWTIAQEANHVGVTGADAFTTPHWGSYMAVLGDPAKAIDAAGAGKAAMPFSSSPVATLGGSQELPRVNSMPWGMNTIRREFTADMTHLVFAYNVFSYFGSGLSHFAYSVRLLDGSGVIASWPMASPSIRIGSRTMTPQPQLETSGWQVQDIDLSQYLHRQLSIEVSVESVVPSGAPEKSILKELYGPTWAYFDVNPNMPIVRTDMMPEVRFVVPTAPGATVAGTSMDVVIEASDDQAIADVRLLVNGIAAGQSTVAGTQTFHVNLREGLNTLQAIAMDGSGKQAMVEMTVMADAQGPVVTLDRLIPAQTTSGKLAVLGTVQDQGSGVRSLAINGESVATDGAGGFSTTVRLQPGTNEVIIEAVDNLGNITSQTFTVKYGTTSSATPSSLYVVLTIGSANMEVNGMTRTMDAAPFIKDGRTLLPIRALIEALGGSVQWNASARSVDVMLGSRAVSVGIGGNIGYVNGKVMAIDPANPKVVPVIIGSRTFLPLRFIAENLGLDLAWEPVSRTVSLTYWP